MTNQEIKPCMVVHVSYNRYKHKVTQLDHYYNGENLDFCMGKIISDCPKIGTLVPLPYNHILEYPEKLKVKSRLNKKTAEMSLREYYWNHQFLQRKEPFDNANDSIWLVYIPIREHLVQAKEITYCGILEYFIIK